MLYPEDYYEPDPVEHIHYAALDGMPLCLYGDVESHVTKNMSKVTCLLCKEIYYD